MDLRASKAAAANAGLRRGMGQLKIEESAAQAGQSASSLRESQRSQQERERPHGMPAARRDRPGVQAEGSTPRRVSAPGTMASPQVRRDGPAVDEGSSSASHFLSTSPVLSENTLQVLEPPSKYQMFKGLSNVVGAMYDPALVRFWHAQGDARIGQKAEAMVRCSDGVVRRFPSADSNGEVYGNQIRGGRIYDIPADFVTNRIGGFELTEDGRHAAFMVNGYHVSPIRFDGKFKAYPLPNNRVMVPQVGFRACTVACEQMMLFDHGYIGFDNTHGYTVPQPLLESRGEIPSFMHSLQSFTGVAPVLVEHQISYKTNRLGASHESRVHAWRDIADKIDEMGPCSLWNKGHVLMLDRIREEKGKFYLTIREPFHGTSLEFRDSEKFFPDAPRDNTPIKAIFLPSKT